MPDLMPASLHRAWRCGFASTLLVGSFLGSAGLASALPFDPVPMSFQRWLNSRKNWPHNEQRRFDGLAECSDQTAASSPYRMPVFTCLKGKVTIQRSEQAPQQCQIQRVSYFPDQQRVRLWTEACR
jgi:hypothetical protein